MRKVRASTKYASLCCQAIKKDLQKGVAQILGREKTGLHHSKGLNRRMQVRFRYSQCTPDVVLCQEVDALKWYSVERYRLIIYIINHDILRLFLSIA